MIIYYIDWTSSNAYYSIDAVFFCFLFFLLMPVILFSSKQSIVAVHGHWYGVFMGKYSCFYDEQYRIVSNIRRTLVDNKNVDHSDVVGASPVGAAPTTSSFST